MEMTSGATSLFSSFYLSAWQWRWRWWRCRWRWRRWCWQRQMLMPTRYRFSGATRTWTTRIQSLALKTATRTMWVNNLEIETIKHRLNHQYQNIRKYWFDSDKVGQLTSQVTELQKSLSSLQVFLPFQPNFIWAKMEKSWMTFSNKSFAARDGLNDKQAASGAREQGNHRWNASATD